MNARIRDKIRQIESYLSELEETRPATLHEYRRDGKTRAACERHFEKIVEAATDAAFLVIRELNLTPPEDDKEAFSQLAKNGLLDIGLSTRLKEAKGMRNILAHQYAVVNHDMVYETIQREIVPDMRAFNHALTKKDF